MIKRLWNLLGKYKKLLIISTILVVVEIVFDLLIPVLMQEIIDTGIKGNSEVRGADGALGAAGFGGWRVIRRAVLARQRRAVQTDAHGDV